MSYLRRVIRSSSTWSARYRSSFPPVTNTHNEYSSFSTSVPLEESEIVKPSIVASTLSAKGGISIKAVDATKVVYDVCTRHNCSPLATVALGRTLIGNILLASGKDRDEVCQLNIKGNGVLKHISTEAEMPGPTNDTNDENTINVRGTIQNPTAKLPLLDNGTLDIAKGIGIGILQVNRSHPSWKEPFSGSVILETSDIAQDLGLYLCDSEQIHSAISLGVYGNKDGEVRAAGFLCTVLPGCSEDELAALEKNIGAMGPLSYMIQENKTVDDIVSALGNNLGEQFREYTNVKFQCSCSEQAFLDALRVLPKEDIEDILTKDETSDMQCMWCNGSMQIPASTLKKSLNL